MLQRMENLNCFRTHINTYRNGVFVESVQWSRDSICFSLNDPELRKNNGENVSFDVVIELQIFGEGDIDFGSSIYTGEYDYNVIDTIYIKLDLPNGTDYIHVKMSFDDSVMYENRLDVRNIMVV